MTDQRPLSCGLCTAPAAQLDDKAVADVSFTCYKSLSSAEMVGAVTRSIPKFSAVICGKGSNDPRILAASSEMSTRHALVSSAYFRKYWVLNPRSRVLHQVGVAKEHPAPPRKTERYATPA